ncbi:MAG: hypothetical protein IPL19_22810 [Sandaracinaceae bacterium]|nr:hypothetical protein [Sandaracinaceae bacterium]MBK8410788.1 hypothetical protein [Sandaracinaceae bacterium]
MRLRCDEADLQCESDCVGPSDADGDGHDAVVCGGDDCDDSDPERFPGNIEVCDGGPRTRRDEDCDPMTLGNLDADGDGDVAAACCNPSPAGDLCGLDCDDGSDRRRSGQVELCDEVDNDCDSRVDEQTQEVPWFPDTDGDGFGDPDGAVQSCFPVAGSSLLGTDCNDVDAQVHPGLIDICDSVDTDCNGVVDDDPLCAESVVVPSEGATLSLTTTGGVHIVVEVPAGAVPAGTRVALGAATSASVASLSAVGTLEDVPFAVTPLDTAFTLPLRITVTTGGVASQVFYSVSLSDDMWDAVPVALSGGILSFSTRTSGVFTVVRPACTPAIETCDGVDNDCDGLADEGGVCATDGVFRPDPVSCPTADAGAETVFHVVSLNVPTLDAIDGGTAAGHDLDARDSTCGTPDFVGRADNAMVGLADSLHGMGPWQRFSLRRAFTEAVACRDGDTACHPLRIRVRVRPGAGCAELRMEDAETGDPLTSPFGVSVAASGRITGAAESLSLPLSVRAGTSSATVDILLERVMLTGQLSASGIRALTIGGVWEGSNAESALRAAAPALFLDDDATPTMVGAAVASRLDLDTPAGTCAGLSVGLVGEALPWNEALCSPGEFEATPPSGGSPRTCSPCPPETFSDRLNASTCQMWRGCPDGTLVTRVPTAKRDRVCGPFQWARAIAADVVHRDNGAAGPYAVAPGLLAGVVTSGAVPEIRVVDESGTVVQQWTVAGAILDEFECAVDGSGRTLFGGAYVAGAFASDLDGIVRAFDESGTQMWGATLAHFPSGVALPPPTSAERVRGVATASDGRVVAVGTAEGPLGQTSTNVAHHFARALFDTGLTAWTYEDATSAVPTSVAFSPTGGVCSAGQTQLAFAGQTLTGNRDGFVQCLSSTGSLLWTRLFGAPNTTTLGQVDVTDLVVSASSVYVVGSVRGAFAANTSAGGKDAFLARLSLGDGTVTWVRQLGSSADDVATAVELHPDGRVFVLGYTGVAATGAPEFGALDGFVLVSDPSGHATALHAFGTPSSERTSGLTFDEQGDLVIMLATFGTLHGVATSASGQVFAALPTLEAP